MKPYTLTVEHQRNPLGIDNLHPRFSWQFDEGSYGDKQTAYRILVSSTSELLQRGVGDLWDSGRVTSAVSTHISYEGRPLHSRQQCWWKVEIWDGSNRLSTSHETGNFSMGLLQYEDWSVKWIEQPAIMGCPLFRRRFTTGAASRRAMLYVTAQGIYRARINGMSVSEDHFTPGWTDYHQRIVYQCFDVTSLLRSGENVIALTVAPGWYSGKVGMFGKHLYGDRMRVLAQLEIDMEDGSTTRVVTDNLWKAHAGPVVEADLIDGERYDARLEIPDWDKPGISEDDWEAVVVSDLERIPKLSAQTAPSIKVMERLKPIAISVTESGKYVFDMGQNMVGRARLRVSGLKGTEITLRFAEVTYPSGEIYLENLRDAKQTDVYVLRGDGKEEFAPEFTVHGFRYVEVDGLPSVPDVSQVLGEVMYAEMEPTGWLTTSNQDVNQLVSNILWGQKGNFLAVPTDCPQRDERLGWSGDAQIFCKTACFNMNVVGFLEKWLLDTREAQLENGAFTDVAPDPIFRDWLKTQGFQGKGYGVAGWGDAGVVVPWVLYEMYGDRKILVDQYPAIQRWINFLKVQADGYLQSGANGYGDWLSIDADTPLTVVATSYYAYSVKLASKIASILEKFKDEEEYNDLFIKIRTAFRETFLNEKGEILGQTQTGYALALNMDLLEPDEKTMALNHLIADIEQHGHRLTTGFLGVAHLLPALSQSGRTDVVFRLLLQDKYPSWLYPIHNGATTIWERWDGWTEERGFQDPGMNSFNHYAFGSVGEWLYQNLAGIKPLEPGFKRIQIKPEIGKGIEWVDALYHSIHGNIACRWEKTNKSFVMRVEVPTNTDALVYVPKRGWWAKNSEVRMKAGEEWAKKIEEDDDYTVYDIPSGVYEFQRVM